MTEIKMTEIKMTEIKIEELKMTEIKIEEEDVCCICLDTFNKSLVKKMTCCNKTIHSGCLIELMMVYLQDSCPLCRSHIAINISVPEIITINYLNDKKIHPKILSSLFSEYFSKSSPTPYENVGCTWRR